MPDQKNIGEKFIDREVEREEFQKMLKFGDGTPRLLTIKDEGGRGKSALLKQLQYECHYIEDIPASLILLDNKGKKIPSAFDLVKAIREDLKNFESLKFTKFDTLENARMLKDPTPFSDLVGSSTGFVNTENAEIKDRAIVAGRVDTIIQNVEKLELKQHAQWPNEDYEEFVRTYCIFAFFEDLFDICKEKPVVILLDVWERCEESLQRWIMRPMLQKNCFEVSERPAKLIFVLAGRTMPPLKERLKDRYSNLVVSREKLSEWSFEHMKEFLKVHGYENFEDKVIEVIRERVNSDKTLDWALNMAKTYVS